MTSTFHGLEVSKRALTTQQTALYTVGHNIANANTPGYTRQRVNFETTNPFPSVSLNRPQIPGQIGTGVKVGDVQRIRDGFTDMQYRTESSKLGYWQAKSAMLSQMEDIMNEPSDTGLSSSMDEFWNALQDLAVQPQNDGARRVVRERGVSLANTFNYVSGSLKAIQTDYRKEIDATQNNVNSLLRQINAINKQIGTIEPHGYLPNDLYDERDRLLDELSSIVNIKADTKPSGGLASANAEGLLDVYLATPEGEILTDSNGEKIKLIDAATGKATGMHIQYESRTELDSPVTQIKFFELNENDKGFVGLASDTDADNASSLYSISLLGDFNTNGTLKGYIEGYGFKEGDDVKGTYNDMLADLDQMAYTFATHFNLVHSSGWSMNEIQDEKQHNQGDFFTVGTLKGAAANLKVSQTILDDVQNIAAAAEGNVLAGAMKRVEGSVDVDTVGNPSFTGIFDTDSIPPTWNDKASEIQVELSSNGTNWTYTFTAKDKEGNPLEDTVSGSFSNNKKTLLGIEFDLSNVTFSEETTGGNWTYSFKAEGVKKSDEAFIGNGSNALSLANVKDSIINYGGSLTNVQSFYQGMIGKLGDNASEANRMTYTASTLKDSVEQRRLSVSSVSLDEEMTNMIKFQHAYNAAARNITMIDEMLDKIINGMGVVGR